MASLIHAHGAPTAYTSLLSEQAAGSRWALVGLEVGGGTGALFGDKLVVGGAEVGFVTSGLCSGSIGRNIALASVR